MSDLTDFFPSSGGGSGTIGTVSSFVPDPSATFVTGQEVYTDPVDSSVWLRSGATLTGLGSGVLDANLYRDSVPSITTVPNTYSGSTNFRNFAPGGCYVGNNKFLTCPFISNGVQRNSVYDVSLGTFSVDVTYSYCQLFDGQYGQGNGNSNNVGAGNVGFPSIGTYNSTHHFLQGNLVNYISSIWREDSSGIFNIRYVPFTDTTNATTRTPYTDNSKTFKSPFPAIGLQNYNTSSITTGTKGQHLGMAITNPSSNERHWFIKQGFVCNEYTFNPAAANNTNPYTATGNSITIPFTWDYIDGMYQPRAMFSEGNSLYFVWGNGQDIGDSAEPAYVYEYDATTRTLISTTLFYNPVSSNGGGMPLFMSAVPAAITGNQVQYWATTPGRNTVMSFASTVVLKGPFTNDATYPEITAKTQLSAGTSFNAKQIYTNQANERLYTWLKIA